MVGGFLHGFLRTIISSPKHRVKDRLQWGFYVTGMGRLLIGFSGGQFVPPKPSIKSDGLTWASNRLLTGFNVTGMGWLLIGFSRTTLSPPKHRLKPFNRLFREDIVLPKPSIKSDGLLMGFNVTGMGGFTRHFREKILLPKPSCKR
jgi:hypothetical protein